MSDMRACRASWASLDFIIEFTAAIAGPRAVYRDGWLDAMHVESAQMRIQEAHGGLEASRQKERTRRPREDTARVMAKDRRQMNYRR
jgi:hypothetical protein